jgi:hypothetical protein
MIAKAYKLTYDATRFDGVDEEMAYDAYVEPFWNWNILDHAFHSAFPFTVEGFIGEYIEDDQGEMIAARLPKSMEFHGPRPWPPPTDFPVISDIKTAWSVMSKRMIEVLLTVGNFPHQVIPVVFICGDEEYDEIWNNGPPPKPIYDYAILQLLEISSFLDLERAEYTNIVYSDGFGIFTSHRGETVFIEPEQGFPPIFRVRGCFFDVYVSAVAKRALEEFEIRGLSFEPVECL